MMARYRAEADGMRTATLIIREQVTPFPRTHQYIPTEIILLTICHLL